MPIAPPAIELLRLRKTFGPRTAVEAFDLAIAPGELVGFIGPNGAGKTTTIRMIMSIIFPDSGTISVLGRASAVESKDRIGYLPEERGLYKKMKVGAFLEYMAHLKGMSSGGLSERVKTWLDRVGLGDCAKKRCEELSKGMQQKVQFITAVIHEPDLIILDEPFSGLDPVNSRVLRGLIDEQHRAGKTIIFSTHQMSQAEALCDRVVMIHQGKKVLDDTPAAIRSKFDPRSVELEPGRANVAGSLADIAEVASTSANNGSLRVELHEGVDAAGMIPRLAMATAARRIEVIRPTLEDVFIEIVEGTASETEKELLRASLRAGGGNGRSDKGGD